MPSSLSHRLVVSALFLAVLLALAPPPAQASTSSGVLDSLGAKVQSWLAAWLPATGLKGSSATATSGRTSVVTQAQVPATGSGRKRSGRSIHPIIKPGCSITTDPNGCI